MAVAEQYPGSGGRDLAEGPHMRHGAGAPASNPYGETQTQTHHHGGDASYSQARPPGRRPL